MSADTEPPHPARKRLSEAARANAREEWAKADALYDEYRRMNELAACSLEAEDAAWEAYARAHESAVTLDRLRRA